MLPLARMLCTGTLNTRDKDNGEKNRALEAASNQPQHHWGPVIIYDMSMRHGRGDGICRWPTSVGNESET